MTREQTIYETNIIRYYEDCQVDYELVWHLNSHMCMHYGYWTEQTKSLREALNRMNQELVDQAGITEQDYVLDAGCGVGGSSIYLAKNIGCQVKGITLTPKQVEACSNNAKKYDIANRVSFEKQNYLATSFADNTFDVVWAIESVCYALNKVDFLKEAYRVLKPGGRLVIADFYAEPYQSGSKDAALMDKWTNSWAIKAYAKTTDFLTECGEIGFQNVILNNATNNVLPSIKRLYYYFFPGVVITSILQKIGLRNATQSKNTWSTYYQYLAYKRGLWSYNIISCNKPNS